MNTVYFIFFHLTLLIPVHLIIASNCALRSFVVNVINIFRYFALHFVSLMASDM